MPAAPPIWPQQWAQDAWQQPRFLPFAVADRVFRSTDDLLFATATTQRDRPALQHDPTTGMPQYTGGYTWFAMISPAHAEVDSTARDMTDSSSGPDLAAVNTTRQFNVSVIVCNNRILDVPANLAPEPRPGEWMVPAQVTGLGLSGGEVTLYPQNQNQAEFGWLANVHPGQWVMLSAIAVSQEPRNNSGNTVAWPRFQMLADWYRIVAVDDGSALTNPPPPFTPFRSVTLHGSDWRTLDASGNPIQFAPLTTLTYTAPFSGTVHVSVFATFVEGVIGVYQKTITLDGDSAWALPQ